MIKYDVFEPTLKQYHEIKDKLVSSHMLLKEKLNGEIKARFVGNGKREIMSEYDITNSPTISTKTLMTGLAATNRDGFKIAKADVDAAYLQSNEMQKELYMLISRENAKQLLSNPKINPNWKNFTRSDGTLIVKLKKGIYGLKESARLWNETLTKVFTNMGYKKCEADECLLTKRDNTGEINAFIHVDDILFVYNSDTLYRSTIVLLEMKFGTLKIQKGEKIDYLGMELVKTESGDMIISMSIFINKLLREYDISTGMSTPSNDKLYESSGLSVDKTKYKSLVAKVMYLATKIRYDILFTVSYLSTKSSNPLESDWNALIRVLQYIYSTKDRQLVFKQCDDINKVNVYVDAAHCNNIDSLGTTGYIIYLGDKNAGVYARAIKQRLHADASYDAELIAFNEATKTVENIILVMKHLGLTPNVIMREDNMPAINTLVDKKACTTRSKAINNRVECTKSRLKRYNIMIEHCKTEDMIADVLTKVLPEAKFVGFRNLMLN